MDILQDLPEFIDYFRQLATKNKALKDFANGSADRIIALDSGDLKYPALWLEMPTLVPDENEAEHLSGTWSSALVVLHNINDLTNAQEDQVWADTLRIMRAVLSKVKADRRGFKINRKPIEAINPMLAHLAGWRVEFELEFCLDLELDENEWEA